MADYTTLGSFNTGGAASLNGELIQKLYDADSKSRVAPIEKSIELIATETTVINDINTKVNELIPDKYTNHTKELGQLLKTDL